MEAVKNEPRDRGHPTIEAEAFRQLVDSVQEYAIFMLDLEGRVLSWNKGARRIKGYAADEIIGQHFSIFYPPEVVANGQCDRELVTAREQGKFEEEGWRLRKGGSRFYASVVITPVRDAADRIVAFSKVTRDLTERRQAEEVARRLAEEKVARAAAEAAEQREKQTRELVAKLQRVTAAFAERLLPEGVGELVIKEALRAFEASAALFSTVSRDKKTLELMSSANTAAEIAAPFRSLPMDAPIPNSACAREGVPFYFESRAQMVAAFPALASSRISNSTHAVICLPLVAGSEVLGVLTLVFPADREFSADDRTFAMALAQQAAQALQRATLFQNQRVRQRRDAFLAQGSAILASSIEYEETLSALTKLVVPELADWCGIEIAGEDGAPSRQLAVAHVDPKKVAFAIELREKYPTDPNSPYGLPNIFRTGKSELYGTITEDLLVRGAIDDEHLRICRELGMASVMLVPLKAQGQVAGVLTLVSAESGKHYDEDDLELVEELARRAGTAIEHARLYREAKEAVTFRDDFLAVASHDLRTPLSTMKLQLEVMLHGKEAMPLDAANKKRFDRIERAVTSLTQLINKLFDVSNLNFNRLKLERESVDMVQIVRDVLERLQEESTAARCVLELSVSQPKIVGIWDKIRLEQIVTNLMTNAIKYGREHPIEVELSASHDRATFCVRDHGIGIARANQTRIFARFERAVSGRSYSGMGIGLWIVKKLVTAHGGTIEVKSELAAGAAFTVTLPIAANNDEGVL